MDKKTKRDVREHFLSEDGQKNIISMLASLHGQREDLRRLRETFLANAAGDRDANLLLGVLLFVDAIFLILSAGGAVTIGTSKKDED